MSHRRFCEFDCIFFVDELDSLEMPIFRRFCSLPGAAFVFFSLSALLLPVENFDATASDYFNDDDTDPLDVHAPLDLDAYLDGETSGKS